MSTRSNPLRLRTVPLMLWLWAALMALMWLFLQPAEAQNPTPTANLARTNVVKGTNLIAVVTHPGVTNGTRGVPVAVLLSNLFNGNIQIGTNNGVIWFTNGMATLVTNGVNGQFFTYSSSVGPYWSTVAPGGGSGSTETQWFPDQTQFSTNASGFFVIKAGAPLTNTALWGSGVSSVPLTITAAAGQDSNLISVKNSGGTVIWGIGYDGVMYGEGANSPILALGSTAGHIWTASDTTGIGTWAAPQVTTTILNTASNAVVSLETTRNAAVSNALVAFAMTASNDVYTTETTRNAAVSNAVVSLETTRNAAVSNALAAYIDTASSNRVRLAAGTGGITLSQSGSGGVQTWTINDDDAGGGGDVTAASSFGADNRIIRSDGTGKGVQASGLNVGDDHSLSGVSNITMEADADLVLQGTGGITMDNGSASLNEVTAATWLKSPARTITPLLQVDAISNALPVLGDNLHLNGSIGAYHYTASSNASLVLTNLQLNTPVSVEIHPASLTGAGWSLTFNLPAAAWPDGAAPAVATNAGPTIYEFTKVSSTRTNARIVSAPGLAVLPSLHFAIATNHVSRAATFQVTNFTGSGAIMASNAPLVLDPGLIATNGNNAYLRAALSNAAPVTNFFGQVELASASVLTLDALVSREWIQTNRMTATVTAVWTNYVKGARARLVIVGEAAGGTDRVVTIIPKLGDLLANYTDIASNLFTSAAITVTNGQLVEIDLAADFSLGTNIVGMVYGRAKR